MRIRFWVNKMTNEDDTGVNGDAQARPGYPDRDPQLMYELAKDRVSAQLDVIDAIDGKLATLFSLASALLGLTAAVYALQKDLMTGAIVTLAVGGVVYLGLAVAGIFAYRSRDWEIGPSLDAIWTKHRDTTLADDALKWEVANDFMYCYEANAAGCSTKAKVLPWVFAGVAVESLVLVTALALVAAT